MASFDQVEVQLLVRDGDRVGEGDAVYEERQLLRLEDVDLSLDELFELVPRFLWEKVGMHDGYTVRVEGRAWSQGGDGQTLNLVIELVDGLRTIASDTVVGLFSAWLYDKFRKRDSE